MHGLKPIQDLHILLPLSPHPISLLPAQPLDKCLGYLHREQFDFCINQVSQLMLKYNLNTYNTKILVDASAPSVVSALKSQMNEAADYITLLDYRKKIKLRDPFF